MDRARPGGIKILSNIPLRMIHGNLIPTSRFLFLCWLRVFAGGQSISVEAIFRDNYYYDHMYVHNADTKIWESRASMPSKMDEHAMVSVGGCIYVLGAKAEKGIKCYFYEPDDNQWTTLTWSDGTILCDPLTTVVYKGAIYALRQCEHHSGFCLVRLEHIQVEMRSFCVTILNGSDDDGSEDDASKGDASEGDASEDDANEADASEDRYLRLY